jgi:hypothetical protein
VDGGFRAVGDREILQGIATNIQADAKWLLQSKDGVAVDDWDEWARREAVWRNAITNYGTVARRYLSDVPQAISNVPPEALQGSWQDNIAFPNPNAMIAHRAVAVIMRNFAAQHQRTIDCVTSRAFNTPSTRGEG